MTYQTLASRLTELVNQICLNSLPLSSNQIVDQQIEQELDELLRQVMVQQQSLAEDFNSIEQGQALLGLISGLYIWNGSMDNSHRISQDLENNTGSYLHGILHRMEPDYSNAKYWFRMAGGHPVGKQLQQNTLELLRESGNEALIQKLSHETSWNPVLFTDIVATTLKAHGNGNDIATLEQIQALELRLLMEAIVV